MLLLSFNISKERYVIETKNIVEIVPMVILKKIPGAGDIIAGMLNYHGQAIPVIDINALCSTGSARKSLTTRIILVKYRGSRLLGVLAEKVTETINIKESNFEELGVKVSNYDFLGKITEHDDKLLQLINVDQLLTETLQDIAFPEESYADNL